MNSKGYEAIRDSHAEMGIQVSFVPHLFEGDEVRNFGFITDGRRTPRSYEEIEDMFPGVKFVMSRSTYYGVEYAYTDENISQ